MVDPQLDEMVERRKANERESVPAAGSVPIVECGQCGGSGYVRLRGGLLRTLNKLRNTKAPLTTTDLLEKGVNREAICNRLIALEELELVEKAGKRGRLFEWVARNAKDNRSDDLP